MTKRTETLLVLALLGAFFLFLTTCSCENENLVDPPDFFDSADSYDPSNPDFWPICDHPCGLLASPPQSSSAPPPGGEILICTGDNPASESICIEFQLRTSEDVAISVYSQKGEKVKTLLREHVPAVTRSCTWDLTDDSGREVADGTYRAFFKAGDYVTHGDIIVRR